MKRAKKEEPKKGESNFVVREGHHTIEGYWYQGVAVYMNRQLQGKETEVILLCPTLGDLQRAAQQFDPVEKGQICVEGYYKRIVAGAANKLVGDLYWYYDDKSKWAFWAERNSKRPKQVIELGQAVRKTEGECKILLRNYGYPIDFINKVSISTNDEDIPF